MSLKRKSKQNAALLHELNEKGVALVAVSKTQPPDAIMELYNAGHRIFGENRVPEIREKYDLLPKDIEWHFVGHLQTNKVKYIAPFVHCIQSVDSLKLMAEIDKRAKKHERKIKVLLQVHIARETSKFGFAADELPQLFEQNAFAGFTHVSICGLMGMATFTQNRQQINDEFALLHRLFEQIKSAYFKNQTHFNTLSMGMSGDYELAIAQGSNMVRIGSLLFGERN